MWPPLHGPFVAILGMLGGFLMPAFLGGAAESLGPIVTYLILLQAGLVTLARYRDWSPIAGLATLATLAWATLAVIFAESQDDRVWAATLMLATAASSLIVNLLTATDHRHAKLWLAHAAASAGFATIGLTVLAFLGGYTVTDLSLLAIGGAGTIAIARFRPALFALPCIAAAASALLTFAYYVDHLGSASPQAPTVFAWLCLAFGSLFTLGPIAAGIGAPLRHRLHTLAGLSAFAYFALALNQLPLAEFRTPLALAAAGAAAALFAATRIHRPIQPGLARSRHLASLALPATGLITLAIASLLPWEFKGIALGAVAVAAAWLTDADPRNPWRWVLGWSLPLAILGLITLTPVLSPLDSWPPMTMLATQLGAGLVTLALVTWRFHVLAKHTEPGSREHRQAHDLVKSLVVTSVIYIVVASVWLIRHAFHGSDWLAEPSMNEVGTFAGLVLASAVALMAISIRQRWQDLEDASLIIATNGAALATLGAMTLFNPLWTNQSVGHIPVLNTLLVLFGLPMLAAAAIARLQFGRRPAIVQAAGASALLLLFVFVSTQVRQVFVGPVLDLSLHPITQPESYTYSAAWVALGLALLVAGIAYRAAFLRFGSLAVMLIAIVKVFVFDTGTLDGLWRIVSFMGLGLSLMALGFVYQRFVFRSTSTVSTEPEKQAA
ncbi:MAG: DUF2339 domain-containing protein [Planctomycetota bacterium]